MAELVLEGVGDADAVERFAVGLLGFAAEMKRHAGGCEQVALVGGVDEHPAGEPSPAFADECGDAWSLFFHAAFAEREPFSKHKRHVGLRKPLKVDLFRHMRLKGPHLFLTAVARAATALVGTAGLMHPSSVVGIVESNAAIELTGEAADGCLVADVGSAKSAGSQAADMGAGFDEHDRLPHLPGLDRRHNATGGAAVDDDVCRDGSCGSSRFNCLGCRGCVSGGEEDRTGEERAVVALHWETPLSKEASNGPHACITVASCGCRFPGIRHEFRW